MALYLIGDLKAQTQKPESTVSQVAKKAINPCTELTEPGQYGGSIAYYTAICLETRTNEA